MVTLTKYVRADGTFDLTAALKDECPDRVGKPAFKRAMDFLDESEDLVPIRRITTAAMTLKTAADIARSPA